MNAFIQTAHAAAPIALVAAAICAGAYLGIKAADKWAARNVDRMVDDGLAAICAAEIADDAWMRYEAERRLLDWQAHVNGVFQGAMSGQPEPTPDPLDDLTVDWLTVVLDDDVAVAEWLEAGS